MERARDGLHKIVADALAKAPAAETPLLAWPLVCGPQLAQKTRALDFNAGVLRVEVPDAAWATQLLVFVPRYLASVNKLSRVQVTRIQFVVAGSVQAARGAAAGERP
jgi:predicted nucleic acid-binding Zn ribbon protein